jgi:hypothetical protein
LFDRVLSADEIAAIYNAGSSGSCKPQVAISTSTAIPNGTGNFISLFRPGFNGSSVAFLGTGSGGQQGIYFKTPVDPCKLIADLNTPIPEGIGNFLSFTNDSGSPSDPCIGRDNVVFYGTGSDGQQGIYAVIDITIPPNPIKVADLNTAIPSGTGNFTAYPTDPCINGDIVSFIGNGSGGQQGIYIADISAPNPSLVKIADLNTAIPGGTGNFTGFSPQDPCVNGNRLAFVGAGSEGQQGVYVKDDVTLPTGPCRLVADLNTAIPDGTGNFTDLAR